MASMSQASKGTSSTHNFLEGKSRDHCPVGGGVDIHGELEFAGKLCSNATSAPLGTFGRRGLHPELTKPVVTESRTRMMRTNRRQFTNAALSGDIMAA